MPNAPLPARLLLYLLPVFGAGVIAFFSFLMFRIVWPYTSGRLDIDFLLSKQHVIHFWHYRLAFYLHIFPALLVLMAGMTQFSGLVLQRTPAAHRWVGRVYAWSILAVCGPAGMLMAWYANGGAVAKTSFLTLSIFWWWTTWVAYRAIRAGNYRRHGAWMIRSYALTLSAVTLRLMQFGLAVYSDIDPETAYRLVAWPSWVLNLLAAEIVLRNTRWFSCIYRKNP